MTQLKLKTFKIKYNNYDNPIKWIIVNIYAKDFRHAKSIILGKNKNAQNFILLKNESINVPIEIGDTILTGKFRNKKVVVKTITVNERNEPLVNGKPILNIRLTASDRIEMLHESIQIESVSVSDTEFKNNKVIFIKKLEKKIKSLIDKKTKIEYRLSKYGLHIQINHYDWNHPYKAYISKNDLNNINNVKNFIEMISFELEALFINNKKEIKKYSSDRIEMLHESIIRNDTEFVDTIDELRDEYAQVKNFFKKFGIGYGIKSFSDEKGATSKIRKILQKSVEPKKIKDKNGDTVFVPDKTTQEIQGDMKKAIVKYKDGTANFPDWKLKRVANTELSSMREAGKLAKWYDLFGELQTVIHVAHLDSKTGLDSKAFSGSIFTIKFLLENPEYRIPLRPNDRCDYRLSRKKQNIKFDAEKWAKKFKKKQVKKSVKL